MSETPSFEEFARLVAGVFKADPAKIARPTRAADVDGWDSMTHAMLIMTIEEQYDVAFTDDEIYTLPDVGALYDRTLEHMSA